MLVHLVGEQKQKNKQQWVSQAGQPCALRKGQAIPLICNSERPPWSKVFSFLWPIYWTAQMTQLILPHDLGDQVTKVTLPWEMFNPKSSAALWSPVKPQPSHLLTRRWLNVSYTWPRSGPPWNGSPRAVPWRRKGDQLSEQPGTLPAEEAPNKSDAAAQAWPLKAFNRPNKTFGDLPTSWQDAHTCLLLSITTPTVG